MLPRLLIPMSSCLNCHQEISAADQCDLCPGCLAKLQSPAAETNGPAVKRPVPVTWSLIGATVVAWFVANSLRDYASPFGANLGMRTVSGDWWRLLTAIFVHERVFHLLGNLFFLWLFGKRMERILGAWTFLLFYLSCGLAGSLLSLAVHPEGGSYGASGAVMGLAGGLIVAYGLRARTLSRWQWAKLAMLVLSVVWSLNSSHLEPNIDNPGHIGGLVAGLSLGALLTSDLVNTTRGQGLVFATAAAMLVAGAVVVRQSHMYLIHLDSADRLLNEGRLGDADREIRIALRMKPRDELALHLARQVKARRTSSNACQLSAAGPLQLEGLCGGLACDGRVHVTSRPDGTKVSYQGTVKKEKDENLSETTTTTVLTQTLDDLGLIDCTFERTAVTKQELNNKGITHGGPKVVSERVGNISEFDPRAVSMKDEALSAKP